MSWRIVAATPMLTRGCERLGCERQVPAQDDEEERSVRLLLLGKAAVLAHRFERPLAAEMDDSEQGRLEPRAPRPLLGFAQRTSAQPRGTRAS